MGFKPRISSEDDIASAIIGLVIGSLGDRPFCAIQADRPSDTRSIYRKVEGV
jgi:hypothetical protein